MRIAFVLIVIAGCGSPDDVRGGFGAECTSRDDCGCHDASGDDPKCERSGNLLACLGEQGFQVCTVPCTSEADCVPFGADAFCIDNRCEGP